MSRVSKLAQAITAELNNSTNRTVRAMKQAMAEKLISLVIEAYREKSVGAKDEQGIRWKETQKFKKHRSPMLIDTGRLINGFRFELTDSGIQLFNKMDYAKYVFSQRMPWRRDGRLPKRWIEILSRIAKPFIVEIARGVASRLKA